MKKTAVLLLALLMAMSLFACGQSEAAKAVDSQISALGEITLDSGSLISAAEQAVSNLDEKDQKQLKNTEVLTQARKTYDNLVFLSNVSDVEAAINAIGTVTLDSEATVKAASDAFNNSTAEVQAAVSNASTLTAAEDTLSTLRAEVIDGYIVSIGTVDLDSEEAITTARTALDAADPAVAAKVSGVATLEAAEAKLNDLRVEAVIEAIDAIGTVTANSTEAIENAQSMYDALSSSNAAKVTNLSVLEGAKEALKTAKLAQAKSLLNSFRSEEDPVRGMSFYYSKTEPYYADIRSYVFPYIGMNNKDQIWLCAQLHYTGDDWVFFKKITFSIDGQNTVKLYSYFNDIVRDNAGGKVWEYVNTGDGDKYYDLFWKIADSNKTIVRFEGDNYYYDLTVSQKDKDAIRTVLTAYDALLAAGYTKL